MMTNKISAVIALAFLGAAALVCNKLDRDNPDAVARCNVTAESLASITLQKAYAETEEGKKHYSPSNYEVLNSLNSRVFENWIEYGCDSRPKSVTHLNEMLSKPFIPN